MKKAYIIVASLAACIILYLVEQVLAVDYITKTIAKLILFTVIPYIYLKLVKKSSVKNSFNLRRFETSTFKLGLFFGAVSFAVIIAAYFILRGYIDFNGIVKELQFKSKVTPSNFIAVGLYITFGNSFLEEFFFRGFIFLNLFNTELTRPKSPASIGGGYPRAPSLAPAGQFTLCQRAVKSSMDSTNIQRGLNPPLNEVSFNQGSKKLAYIYSSVLFGLYHIAIFKTWFNPLLIGLALFGLISVGIIFDWLDTKTENFINSWLVHILADSAIIIIGMRMFNMI